MEAEHTQTASSAEYQEMSDSVSRSQWNFSTGIKVSTTLTNTITTKFDIKNLHLAQNKRVEPVISVENPAITLPPIPGMDSTGASFTCPFCFLICPVEVASGKNQWW